ncbi:MAG: glycosyltransferase [candidate division WOR-3 bacterium]
MVKSFKILFVCPRIPHPPIKGDSLRAFYQIRELSKYHKLTLLTFSEDPVEEESFEVLKQMCEKVIIIKHRKIEAIKNIIKSIFSCLPLQCAYYQSEDMRTKIADVLSTNHFDIIHIQLIRMAPYVFSFKSQLGIPVILDFVDALSLNMYKRLLREDYWLKIFFFYEWYKTKKYENRLKYCFAKAIITSPFDSKILSLNDDWLEVIPNGVDLDRFPYYPRKFHEPHTIIFSGNMNYFPNVDAVLFFYYNIYPKIKKLIPEVRFKIVGVNPAPAILRLTTHDKDVLITGYVKNIAEHIGSAAVAVAPMLSGSGIQNKILEAMAVGTPVVATKLATNAIKVTPNKDILLANTPEDFADCVVKLLRDESFWQKLSLNARNLVESEYTWQKVTSKLEAVYAKAVKL